MHNSRLGMENSFEKKNKKRFDVPECIKLRWSDHIYLVLDVIKMYAIGGSWDRRLTNDNYNT